MKISKETISNMEELGYFVGMPVISPQPGFYREVPYEQATHLYVNYRLIKAPKAKEITVDWLLSKINKEAVYQNLSQYLRKVFSSCVSVYPASYGVGVASLFSREDDIKVIAEKLKSLGLKFRNELSDAGWVYRFVISKDASNMRIMESL